MRLISSKTESYFRKELVSSHAEHFKECSDSQLKKILVQKGFNVSNAYILELFPDENELFCTVLVSGHLIVKVNYCVTDESVEHELQEIQLPNYVRGLSRINQVKLAVAQDLAYGKT